MAGTKAGADTMKKKARALYAKGIKITEISTRLKLPAGTVRSWASREGWATESVLQDAAPERSKGGAPKGNKNAAGAGAPRGNQNPAIHGLYSKALPADMVALMMEGADLNAQAIAWWNIQALQARIVRAMAILWAPPETQQRLKKAKGRNVHKLVTGINQAGTGEDSSGVVLSEIEIERTEPWQVEEKALTALSRAMGELRNMLRDYEALYGADPRTELVKAQTRKLEAELAELGKQEGTGDPDPEGFTAALDSKTAEAWDDWQPEEAPGAEGGGK